MGTSLELDDDDTEHGRDQNLVFVLVDMPGQHSARQKVLLVADIEPRCARLHMKNHINSGSCKFWDFRGER